MAASLYLYDCCRMSTDDPFNNLYTVFWGLSLSALLPGPGTKYTLLLYSVTRHSETT